MSLKIILNHIQKRKEIRLRHYNTFAMNPSKLLQIASRNRQGTAVAISSPFTPCAIAFVSIVSNTTLNPANLIAL